LIFSTRIIALRDLPPEFAISNDSPALSFAMREGASPGVSALRTVILLLQFFSNVRFPFCVDNIVRGKFVNYQIQLTVAILRK